jgi:hypothetical protein
MKKTLGFLCGIIFFRNFDDYPGFKPKITPPKHFSRQCIAVVPTEGRFEPIFSQSKFF